MFVWKSTYDDLQEKYDRLNERNKEMKATRDHYWDLYQSTVVKFLQASNDLLRVIA